MTHSAQQILQQAMRLPTLDRATLIEGLIASLDESNHTPGDHTFDTLWLKEAEDRMNAYRAGEIATVDADEVFAELGRTS
uniref:Putative addiction module component, TIGR02574 family n=1 Tax=Candidatus Kentrum sp. SD TaxID=2126332 RepID=A0A450Z365_9GAMM|nr:MAG: putative addiction module component, TIGR02574 family [Candidatus Kentron sp. SD]VFK48240.1 MAG: putative addiction module component, TIGR02574 family [Candidatus Kentron sp. SD]VFK80605.1 MAG: putative addiction module component, TIGR02574 family [Candidatus Kentron sp. SD]